MSVIVGQIAHGASAEEVLEEYPDLEPEDIQQALEYAAWERYRFPTPQHANSTHGPAVGYGSG